MGCTRYNWELLLICARNLTRLGSTPFTRADLIDCVQQGHPDRERGSLDPVIQGMTRNATGGPMSACGEVFERVERGQYVLVEDDHPLFEIAGDPPARRTRRKQEAIERRLHELAVDFAHYLDVFDRSVSFGESAQYEAHRRTIDCRRVLGSVDAAIHDDEFVRLLYRTLRAWGVGLRASRLVPRDRFAEVLRAHGDAIAVLEGHRIDGEWDDTDAAVEAVWSLIRDMPIVENRARIVAGTKMLHHLLPDLVVPMDRVWTGAFFLWSPIDPQSRQFQTFTLTFRDYRDLACRVEPSQYVGEGWRTSATKVLDNAVIGFGMAQEMEM